MSSAWQRTQESYTAIRLMALSATDLLERAGFSFVRLPSFAHYDGPGGGTVEVW
jgi:hypothetical protein